MCISDEYTEIEVFDADKNDLVVKIKLNPRQFAAILHKRKRVPCECNINSENTNKKERKKVFAFQITDEILRGELIETCKQAMKKAHLQDWEAENLYYGQNAFFWKNGKKYARTIIRKFE